MSKRTPYDTGKRSEPKPWQSYHMEDDGDYGKVDFEDDAGGTLAVLYIEHDDDGTWALRGEAWQSLKLEVESNDPTDPDLKVTVAEALLPPAETRYAWVGTVEDDDMSQPLVVVATSQEQLERKLMESYGSEFEGDFDGWFERCSAAATIVWDRYELEEDGDD